MGIFKRTKAQSGTSVGGDLFSDRERERVDALWRLTALPRDGFEATYGVMLGRFWRYVSAPKGEAWKAPRTESLTCAVAALRARQARVLPRFAAAEDVARLAEAMSFALAACVFGERFGLVLSRAVAPGWCPLRRDVPASATLADGAGLPSYGALLLARLVGDAGLDWLAQEPAARYAPRRIRSAPSSATAAGSTGCCSLATCFGTKTRRPRPTRNCRGRGEEALVWDHGQHRCGHTARRAEAPGTVTRMRRDSLARLGRRRR